MAEQARKWYQLTTRDAFMVAGMTAGWIAYLFIERHVHPRPALIEYLPILTMVLGAGIGECVKRMRARGAEGR
jgi:hypothetical protein